MSQFKAETQGSSSGQELKRDANPACCHCRILGEQLDPDGPPVETVRHADRCPRAGERVQYKVVLDRKEPNEPVRQSFRKGRAVPPVLAFSRKM